ncbi:hypothetical protein ABZY45_19330 [Streptomyces sp. NPDC006516]|uniref:hypothetical protein n=1 Tax=Streptomyces sp. NPDC006516 TaxID=3154309 RepID=UPI0033B42CA5
MSAGSCADNSDHICHATVVTIGDATEPVCYTFMTADVQGGKPTATGPVGACKRADCRHNDA